MPQDDAQIQPVIEDIRRRIAGTKGNVGHISVTIPELETLCRLAERACGVLQKEEPCRNNP